MVSWGWQFDITPRDVWRAWGTEPYLGRDNRPRVGDMVAVDFRAWRITAVPDVMDWHAGFTLSVTEARSGEAGELVVRPNAELHRYPDPDHYPVCSCCGDPVPCRATYAVARARRAAEYAEHVGGRAELGACPACGEPITDRQKSIHFPGPNVESLTAPAPTYHLRQQCFDAAARYERRWIRADESRRWRLACPGKIRAHVGGWDCTEGAACPGDEVFHHDRTICSGMLSGRGGPGRCLRCVDGRAMGLKMPTWPGLRRRRRSRTPAAPSGYVVPAAKLNADVHVVDPGRPEHPRPAKLRGRTVVAQYAPGTVIGHTVCGLAMLVEEDWVGYRADPRADGTLCDGCGQAAVVGL